MIGDSKTNGLGGAGVGVCARLPVYVLTGGASSRFGADKANHPIDGEPWAVHVGRRLAPDGSFTLVGDVAVDASGVRRIVEGCPGFGPLGGVTAACRDRFEASGDGWLVVASCDLVRPTRDWLTPLRDATTATALAVAYRDRERWQPMPLIAHTRW
ncbi:MAG: NTP transferase domain-containing protein, partial [Planctomycetota bacterium]